ncbi:MAG TPA: hypothetical protein VK524_00110 [Polyangiaceae bacterium]|nr:hypothetical protein [Polyangiaceae bacterium]
MSASAPLGASKLKALLDARAAARDTVRQLRQQINQQIDQLEAAVRELTAELCRNGRTSRADELSKQVSDLEYDLLGDCPTSGVLDPVFPGLGGEDGEQVS